MVLFCTQDFENSKENRNHIKISGTLPTGESSPAPRGLPGGFPGTLCGTCTCRGLRTPSLTLSHWAGLTEDRGCISLGVFASSCPAAACGAGLLNESVKELMNKCHLTKLCVLTCHLYRCPQALARLLRAPAPARGGFVFIMTSTGTRPGSFRRCSE